MYKFAHHLYFTLCDQYFLLFLLLDILTAFYYKTLNSINSTWEHFAILSMPNVILDLLKLNYSFLQAEGEFYSKNDEANM